MYELVQLIQNDLYKSSKLPTCLDILQTCALCPSLLANRQCREERFPRIQEKAARLQRCDSSRSRTSVVGRRTGIACQSRVKRVTDLGFAIDAKWRKY